ncbi:MAG TPA: energy-coupled thiamine transporter ThiT [Candidatus Dadabacteria bacterium]|nr:energy-coupled thiamine transporter ThiT [Candidatus Dadabacteria bacterium]
MSNFSNFPRNVLAEGAIMISLAVSLDFISNILPSLPQGGSFTIGAMVPILLFAIRRGVKYGIIIGAIFSIVKLAFNPPFIVSPIQFLLDYPIAFGALGLAGLVPSNVVLAAAIGIFGRFIAHFISGIVWFSQYAPEGTPVAVYSAVYNGSYLGIEFIISATLLYIIWQQDILKLK